MRDAAIALPCSVIWLGLLGWRMLASPTPAAHRAFVAIALCTAAAWLAWFILERPKIVAAEQCMERQWRRAKGQCLSCGYDLAGNVSGVCPECGSSL